MRYWVTESHDCRSRRWTALSGDWHTPSATPGGAESIHGCALPVYRETLQDDDRAVGKLWIATGWRSLPAPGLRPAESLDDSFEDLHLGRNGVADTDSETVSKLGIVLGRLLA